LDLARIRKLQQVSRNRMDAGTMPELSATRNRFRRVSLSGCVADRKRCEHRPSLRAVAESRDCGRRIGRPKFIKQARARMDVPRQPKGRTCFKLGPITCSRGRRPRARRVIAHSTEVTDLGYNMLHITRSGAAAG